MNTEINWVTTGLGWRLTLSYAYRHVGLTSLSHAFLPMEEARQRCEPEQVAFKNLVISM